MNSIEIPNSNENSQDNREVSPVSSPEGNLSMVLVENEAKASEDDKNLVERYFGAQKEAGLLDERIIDYFRNYLGPESTMVRFNNMHPDTRDTLVSVIGSGDLDEVVELMESHINNWINNLGTTIQAVDVLPYSSPYRASESGIMEAKSKQSEERFRIRKILEQLNQAKK